MLATEVESTSGVRALSESHMKKQKERKVTELNRGDTKGK